jgi:hypothetical protein
MIVTRTAWEDLKYCGTGLLLLEGQIWYKVEGFRVTFGKDLEKEFRVRIKCEDLE